MSNKRGRQKPRPRREAPVAADEEEWSPAEARAFFIAVLLCWCTLGCLPSSLGWRFGIGGYALYVPVVLIVGTGAAYAALFLFGILWAAYIKFVWRLPVSPRWELFIDEANAILFPDSGEAKQVARRRCCEIDHLVWACSDLEEGIAHIHKITGVKPQRGGKHPQFGTHNALLSLGNGAYLEIIAPDPERNDARMPTIFGLDDPANRNKLVAFAVHPNPYVKGATFELIAQSMHLGRYNVGGIETGKRQSPDGQLLQWKFTSPLCARFAQPFVIDWGTTRTPAQMAPKGFGCQLQKLVFSCSEDEMREASELHRKIGLVDTGARIPVVVEKGDGPRCMTAEITTPKGRKVMLGQQSKMKER